MKARTGLSAKSTPEIGEVSVLEQDTLDREGVLDIRGMAQPVPKMDGVYSPRMQGILALMFDNAIGQKSLWDQPDRSTTAGDLVFFENDNKGSWSHNDFRVGLDYQKDENSPIYGYLATGFKAGGIGDRISYSDLLTGESFEIRTAFDPEEVTTLEIGSQLELLNRKLDLKACYFLSDYEDINYADDRREACFSTPRNHGFRVGKKVNF